MTNKVCPKCKSNNFTFTVEGRGYLCYIVEEGRVIANGGEGVDTSDCTTCTCDECGHSWHPRKFTYEIDE